MTSIPQKKCPQCNEFYPVTTEFYYRNKKTKSGFSSWCIVCSRNKSNERTKQPEVRQKRIEYARQYNKTDKAKLADKKRNETPERRQYLTKKQSQFRKTEKGKVGNFKFAHSQKRRDWEKEYNQRPYRKVKNRSYGRISTRKRKAILKNLTEHHTHEDVMIQLKTQKGLCWWCGEKVGKDYHVDHRIPLARGGSNAANNIVISCPHCNLSKHDKLPHEWGQRLL